MAKKPEQVTGEAEPAAVMAPRISVQMTADGESIDWARMRPETQAKLERGLKLAPFYVPPGAAHAAGEAFPPALCETIYDSLSMLLIGLAQRGGFPAQSAQVLAFTREEKNALVPATIKVLDKYNASLGKYQEEIILGVMLTTVITGKLSLLRRQAQVIRMAPPSSTPASTSQAENEPAS